MRTVVAVSEENGCNGIVSDLGSRLTTGFIESPVCIVDDQFLPEGIDELFGTAGDPEQVGMGGGELNGIPNSVSPETAAGADHHGILSSGHHTAQRHRLRLLLL